ncbi:MAG: hypothetical protein JXR39_09230, partial [Marinilabiliaceae bacterium]|nr:hypothetical protein [Marinilabiliaceae bacterium]
VASPLVVVETDSLIDIRTGTMRTTLCKSGRVLIASMWRGHRQVACDGRLVMVCQDGLADDGASVVSSVPFEGEITRVTLEQNGPVRAVVKVEGVHTATGHKHWLPFVVRLYFYANSDRVRMMHTMVYDGDENHDFIRGVGVRFSVPMIDELHNRHVRFVGDNGGVFGEAVRGITGLRRPAGDDNTSAQIEGRPTLPLDQWNPQVAKGLPYVPVWGDYKLVQLAPNSFHISKRTAQGYAWIGSAVGDKASGTGYVGGVSGGLAFGVRNFWQSFPGQIDIRSAGSPLAEVTLWLWAPDAQPMDMRFYHDGMGQDDYAKQWEGLEITYEDYEPGYSSPMGVARTSELSFWPVDATPSRHDLVQFARSVSLPPVLMPDRAYMQSCGVFGRLWEVRNDAHPLKMQINQKLDQTFDYYLTQQQQHHWYGFWNYGDVMHTYDADRHVWRYDVGGFAWDNSELSTDLWLWYYFLHSGRPETFRMAEAMTRHTGDVDVHHLGAFAPLGSRHNVVHWGCSAKQMRISTAANRRFYYYLTADERVGDLMDEQLEAHRTLLTVQPLRKRVAYGSGQPAVPGTVSLSFGTDWGAISAAWLTRWERTGDDRYRQRLFNSMTSIAAQPRGFFTGGALMDVESGQFVVSKDKKATVSHLSAVFGLVEVCAELNDLIDCPAFEKAWLQYCEFYNAPGHLQQKVLGTDFGKMGLRQAHARLTAYAAFKTGNVALRERAWKEFFEGKPSKSLSFPELSVIEVPSVLTPVTEAPGISTNSTAQWGLAAIQCMALMGEASE